jgi:hypothetical protein
MKKLIYSTLIMLLLSFMAGAQEHHLFEQMKTVNAQWQYQPEALPVLQDLPETRFGSFTEQISMHLKLVEKVLRARNNERWNPGQLENRMRLLNELAVYSTKAIYPVNDYLPYKNPVFIDRNNTHCAVGYLMMVSGHDDLARKIDKEQKFAFVHEIKVKGVKEWADEFGFSIDELAWIQPGYPPAFTTVDLSNGLNGTVHCTAINPVDQTLYAGGEFTSSVNGQPCSYVAQYVSGFAGWDWVGVGNGLNGKVNAMVFQNNKLYAGGDFTMAGGVSVSHVAVFDVISGQWQALGSLDSAVNALAFYNNELYAGGRFTGMLAKWDGTQWLDVTNSYVYGQEIRTLEVFDNLLYIGGSFELPTGALRKNLMAFDGTQVILSGFGTPTPVNDLAVFNNRLYAACDFVEGTDTCAVSMLDAGNWITVLKPGLSIPDFLDGEKLKCFLAVNQHLYAGGLFTASSLMTYGTNLMELRVDSLDGTIDFLDPLMVSDSTVNTLFQWNNNLGFAGAFVSASATLNHIGVLTSVDVTGISKSAASLELNLYPNPTTESMQLTLGDAVKSFTLSVYDVNGKLIQAQTLGGNRHVMETAALSPGFYVLRCTYGSSVEVARFVKQ